MPALNEEKNIYAAVSSTIDALNRARIIAEILVVNDGSTDKTPEIISALVEKYQNVRTINHEKPMGIGYSFFDGVKNAAGDTVVMFPGDNENDPDDALRFLSLLEQVDIIVPFVFNVEVRNIPRRFLSTLFRTIINISFGTNLNYTNGTVFYRKEILKDLTLTSKGFFYQAETLIRLIRRGYLFAEVPVFLSQRASGKSKAVTLRSFLKVLGNYIQLVWSIHIRRTERFHHHQPIIPQSITAVLRKKQTEAVSTLHVCQKNKI